MTRKGWSWLILGGMVVAWMAYAATADRTPANPNNAEEACYYAWQAVRANLKAPGTAEFSSCQDGSTYVTPDQDGWMVVGKVQAQNSFGVPLMHSYSVRMTHGPAGWTSANLQISNQ